MEGLVTACICLEGLFCGVSSYACFSSVILKRSTNETHLRNMSINKKCTRLPSCHGWSIDQTKVFFFGFFFAIQ